MRDGSYSRSKRRDLSPPMRDNQRHYVELLATRVMTFEDFLLEEEVMAVEGVEGTPFRPIPVLLLPGETTTAYEEKFERWLLRRNLTKAFMLLCAPDVERRFRLDFADSRAWELRRHGIAQEHRRKEKNMKRLKPEKIRTRKHYYGIRSRTELLATEVMTSEEYFQATEDGGLNGRMMVHQRLRRIPIILNVNESVDKYEVNFKRWLANKQLSIDMLAADPEEERRYRQCFALARAYSLMKKERLRTALDTLSLRKNTRSRKRTSTRVSELEERVKCQRTDLNDGITAARHARKNGLKTAPHTVEHPAAIKVSELMPVEAVGDGNTSSAQQKIYHEARSTISKVNLMKANAPDEDLITRYTSLNDQIALNELAMTDALTYMKIKGHSNKLETADSLQQIEELGVGINQAKRHRDTALAAGLAQDWEGMKEKLTQLLEERADVASSASHENLAAIHKTLDRNEKEVHAFRIKLTNRLNWLKPGTPTRDDQFQELHELSRKLVAAMGKWSQLADLRKTTSLKLLRHNEELRMLTLELMDEADGVWD